MGRSLAPPNLYTAGSVWILTMMQSCASAAKLRAAGPVNPGKAPYKFESSPLLRRVNELSVPLDEGVIEPPDLLQTRMNGCDQIVVEADQILRRPRAMSRPRARATEAKR